MAALMRFDRINFVAGAIIGGAIISIAWLVASWEPEPPFRHSELYDHCLATGRSVMACDAGMRELRAEIERARRDAPADVDELLPPRAVNAPAPSRSAPASSAALE
jgi:hypothetical protein